MVWICEKFRRARTREGVLEAHVHMHRHSKGQVEQFQGPFVPVGLQSDDGYPEIDGPGGLGEDFGPAISRRSA